LKRERAAGLGEALEAYLKRTGLKRRLDQAGVVDEWPRLVGPQIARVTTAEGVSEDGVLFVRVATAAWMQELQLQSPTILRKLADDRRGVRRIVWRVG
jgi:predicted nucleic acid-binding Zn ribbon protein